MNRGVRIAPLSRSVLGSAARRVVHRGQVAAAGQDAWFLLWIDTSTAPLRMAAAAVLPAEG